VPVINKINSNLEKMADGGRVRFLSINDQLADAGGRLFDGKMNADQLHPSAKAYQVLADALKPIFRELLGPPGQEDHAPPPTGDPSAREFNERPDGVATSIRLRQPGPIRPAPSRQVPV
jgi:hypothetical protein